MFKFRLLALVIVASSLWSGARADGDDLPASARKLLDDHDKDAEAIRKKAQEDLAARRKKLVHELQALEGTSDKKSEALHALLQDITEGPISVKPNPGTLIAFRGQIGCTFHFEVTGATDGSVWGSGVYTDDSSLAVAAVHAGALTVGQKAILKVSILPGQEQYSGSIQHGVSTGSWESFPGSFRIEGVRTGHSLAFRALGSSSQEASRVGVTLRPDPGTLSDFRHMTGQTFYFEVTGGKEGSVWGSDVYTDDSTLAAAAVHAGVLGVGDKGHIKVTILPGKSSYQGTLRNGVRTSSFQSWHASYRIEAVKDTLLITHDLRNPTQIPSASAGTGMPSQGGVFRVPASQPGYEPSYGGNGISPSEAQLRRQVEYHRQLNRLHEERMRQIQLRGEERERNWVDEQAEQRRQDTIRRYRHPR